MASHNLSKVPVAVSLTQQMLGLLGRREAADLFLLIPRCRTIHTWFMLTAIDVVFIDDAHRVVRLVEKARPWRVYRGPDTSSSVLELPPGYARENHVAIGDTLIFADV